MVDLRNHSANCTSSALVTCEELSEMDEGKDFFHAILLF